MKISPIARSSFSSETRPSAEMPSSFVRRILMRLHPEPRGPLPGLSLRTRQVSPQAGDEFRVQLAHARFREAQNTADLLESQIVVVVQAQDVPLLRRQLLVAELEEVALRGVG